jgi:hypothetical protein
MPRRGREMILGAVPYSHANLTITCAVHDNIIEFYADEDSESILDRVQLRCPGLSDAIRELHKLGEMVEGEAMVELGIEWRHKHPEEVAMYPGDWMPRHFTFMDFPLRYQERLKEIDGQLETLADECVDSWMVRLEDDVNHDDA